MVGCRGVPFLTAKHEFTYPIGTVWMRPKIVKDNSYSKHKCIKWLNTVNISCPMNMWLVLHITHILPCSNWFASLRHFDGFLLWNCEPWFIQSVSMDWRDDNCFLCARIDPSICCLYLINIKHQLINVVFCLLKINTTHTGLWTYLRFLISLLITDACCVSFLTCSAQVHTGVDILMVTEWYNTTLTL